MDVSNKFLRDNSGRLLRGMLSRVARVLRIRDLAGLPVFRGATVPTIVLITRRIDTPIIPRYSPPPPLDIFRAIQSQTVSLDEGTKPLAYELPASALASDQWHLVERRVAALIDKMRRDAMPLSTFTDNRICRGVVSGLTEAFIISGSERRAIVRENPEAKEIIFPF